MRYSTKERRRKALEFFTKGHNETEIAVLLGVSRQTIVRDFRFFKQTGNNWLDELAKGAFVLEFKMALDHYKTINKKLDDIYDNSQDDKIKLGVLREKARNIKMYMELLGETPAIHSYRKAMRTQMMENVRQA